MNRSANAVLGGRYELNGLIGIGGMARVYRAHDRILHRDVAVKVLHEDTASDPRFVERFRREAHAAAALNHPNIVSIYDWREEEEDGRPLYYMVMEYVPGKNLKEVIQERGPLPEGEALDIAGQVAQALTAAHARGVIHRDVKPHNILLGPDGRARVADFGIARAAGMSQLTKTNMLCGTAQYLSPEQAQRRPIDGRSDVYSLGIVLYEMLTGTEPFTGDTPIEVAMQHINEMPRTPRELRPDLLPSTQAVVLKALAKDPEQRYQSASDFRVALERARRLVIERDDTTTPDLVVQTSRGEPIERQRTARVPLVPSPPPRERASRHPDRAQRSSTWNRWLLAVPILLLLAVAGGVFAMMHGGTHSAAGLPPATSTSIPPRSAASKHRPTHHRAPSHPPRPTPAIAPTSRPQSPPVVAQQPAPASTPLPAVPPARAPILPTPTATAAAPVSVAASNAGASGPVQAVQTFYQFVSAHDFTDATALWSPTMQASYDPNTYINQRFNKTQQISAQSANVVSETSGQATVAVRLVEISDGGSQRTITGSWQVVKIGGSWYLNAPDLH